MQSLPVPNSEEIATSALLSRVIMDEIQKEGRIPFSRFMELALYEPHYGYYRQSRSPFGVAGDFITAPEVSPLFAQGVAQYAENVFEKLGGGCFLELGAGSGAFARDFLKALASTPYMPKQYFILEVSGARREEQRETLKKALRDDFSRVVWLDRLPEVPFEGIIFSNEVIDALPCSQFQKTKNDIQERYVSVDGSGQFEWQLGEPSSPAFSSAVGRLAMDFPEDYVSEVHLPLSSWIQSLESVLSRGVMLFFDYGYLREEYYHPDRDMGTLRCHYRHHAHNDPLLYPGIQDITAHVDFTAVMEAGERAGLSVLEYMTQAHFLMENGLMGLAEAKADPAEQFKLSNEIKRLTLPSEMGALFKAITLGKGISL